MNPVCIICSTPVPGYKPQFCCNAHDCGCQDLPIEPPICSNKCAAEVYGEVTEEEAMEEILRELR